ncbi:MAG TPA: PIG-L family deacetylase [Dongiaceae bacterium]|jgi:LmbE family N-acetylglucosaminyl deacetylase|nr:PIG-L family deacetylase [Dongiaceae bacterium]
MNPFEKFVSESARVFQNGKKLPLGLRPKGRRVASRRKPDLLIFSPHPDDECIVGGLALRLLREAKWKVANVAVTLGSRRERKTARLRELQNACDFLGFDLIVADLEKINLETRKKSSARWRAAVKTISKILADKKPRVIFLPHENDGHPAHVGTHFLVLDALKSLPKNFKCFVVETEFWGQMTNPNLLVESGSADVGDLIAALACHVGEVRRNPYHARLPAWMIDNVRRGAEIVGGAGASSPDFTFGTIYRLQKWRGGKLKKFFNGGKFLGAKKNPADLFR